MPLGAIKPAVRYGACVWNHFSSGCVPRVLFSGRAATTYDHSTLEKVDQRRGTYLLDTCFNRRDPSGALTHPIGSIWDRPSSRSQLDDSDLVYPTLQSPRVPSVQAASVISPSPQPSSPDRPEFRRKGMCPGEVGWHCAMTKQQGQHFGRVDGHALVCSDLHRKHQFLRLSGDPSFDKRAGKAVQFLGTHRKPAAFSSPAGRRMFLASARE